MVGKRNPNCVAVYWNIKDRVGKRNADIVVVKK